MTKNLRVGRVLVVGGGIAGMEAALSLANAGVEVVIAERSSSIGGGMARLDKTFPTDDCAMCILAPRMLDTARDERVTILTDTTLISLEGEEGSFTARLITAPRMVDPDACTACLECVSSCPVKVPDPFDFGLGETKCIHQPFPQAVPPAPKIEGEFCLYHQKGGVCHKCEKACPVSAIRLDQGFEAVTLEVSSVVAATGFSPVAAGDVLPRGLDSLGHGRVKDVVTSAEFERILSPTGPTSGEVLRPSDGRAPESLAFVLCAGFRDPEHGFAQCGAVCCMFAAKEAAAALERGVKSAAIFYTDLREGGKGFHRYLRRARERYSVELVRARVTEIEEHPRKVGLAYMDGRGNAGTMLFDMAVLAAGPAPHAGTGELAKRLKVETDRTGYLEVSPEDNISTTRPGVYAVGCAAGPVDIPEAVLAGSAAAARAVRLILPEDRKHEPPTPVPQAREAARERVGIFLCRCGVNIGSVLDLEAVAETLRREPGVARVNINTFTCSPDSIAAITGIVRDENLTRVVVGACSPRTHGPVFEAAAMAAGINPALCEMANIREHSAWVHKDEKDAATEKGLSLVEAALSGVLAARPVERISVPVTRRALVVGGGDSGAVAARALAGGGVPTILVPLDGQEADFGHQGDLQSPLLTAAPRARVAGVLGFGGGFEISLEEGGETRTLTVGAAVIAAETVRLEPRGQFLYGEDERVLTAEEFSGNLGDESFLEGARRVTFIQCVGSRVPERAYCSRDCCRQTVESALRIKGFDPRIEVVVAYRDMNMRGKLELEYLDARSKGVVFVPFGEESYPRVERIEANGRTRVVIEVDDQAAGSALRFPTDFLVLATAHLPPRGLKRLASLFKVGVDEDGFLAEAHPKLRPVESYAEGVFLAGGGLYPASPELLRMSALAAAGKALGFLAKDELALQDVRVEVARGRCTGCLACLSVCPVGAISVRGGAAVVEATLCRGCGTCVAECPARAMTITRFTNDEIMAKIMRLVASGAG